MTKIVVGLLVLILFVVLDWNIQSVGPSNNNELRLRDCRKLTNPQDRTGCETIVLTKMGVKQIQEGINNLEKKSSKASAVVSQIEGQKQQEYAVKNKYNITPLEDKMSMLNSKRALLESSTFGTAFGEYQEINNLLNDIINDPIVKSKLETIITLKTDINKKVQPKIDKIRSYGKVIIEKIKNQRESINKFIREELLPLKKELDTLLLSQNADKELNALRIKIAESQMQLTSALNESLTTAERQQIEGLKNSKTRKQIMLKLLENPEKITDISLEELLGLEPIT